MFGLKALKVIKKLLKNKKLSTEGPSGLLNVPGFDESNEEQSESGTKQEALIDLITGKPIKHQSS